MEQAKKVGHVDNTCDYVLLNTIKAACMERVYSCINTLGEKIVLSFLGVRGNGITYLTKIVFLNKCENISDMKLK